MTLADLAKSLNAYERVDVSAFQRRARVLQVLWRQEQDLDPAERGSRLAAPAAEALKNFLTETVRDVVRTEVMDPLTSAGKLYARPRIFNDLLSSQPLCFNLFGELTRDLDLASAVIADMSNARFLEVCGIEFEYSPGRRKPRYLNDGSAFDVFIRCRNAAGEPCFIGVEVKYHENMRGRAGDHKVRYDEVASTMGCFRDDRLPLMQTPLQQIWRDHLLAGITRVEDGYSDSLFVMLYPRDNTAVQKATDGYRQQLARSDSFATWTLEDFVESLRRFSGAGWIDDFVDRYLAFGKIDDRLAG